MVVESLSPHRLQAAYKIALLANPLAFSLIKDVIYAQLISFVEIIRELLGLGGSGML
jgi:hypothetical protein